MHPSINDFINKEVTFFGHVFSAEGVSQDPQKVEALQSAKEPQNPEAVKSFLGMATYCGRFIPNLATLSQPLRELTKESTKWTWGKKQCESLQAIKTAISTDCTMAYFDPQKQTEVVVDASPVGLGAILAQKDCEGNTSIIAVGSRSLAPVEQRYSQTEREALAITWGVLHFHLYLYGNKFTVLTDHKPLVPPTRVERWILKL